MCDQTLPTINATLLEELKVKPEFQASNRQKTLKGLTHHNVAPGAELTFQ